MRTVAELLAKAPSVARMEPYDPNYLHWVNDVAGVLGAWAVQPTFWWYLTRWRNSIAELHRADVERMCGLLKQVL